MSEFVGIASALAHGNSQCKLPSLLRKQHKNRGMKVTGSLKRWEVSALCLFLAHSVKLEPFEGFFYTEVIFKFHLYFISILVSHLLIIDNDETFSSWTVFMFAKTHKIGNLFCYKLLIVSFSISAVLSRFQNWQFCPFL